MLRQRTKRPIYLPENGAAPEDAARRIAFIDEAVAGVKRCVRDGIDLRGYIHWSLLDNWEWVTGYGPKFGLVAVDRTTFARTPKPSARHLGAIARKGLAR
jgi:beta-glucosidase